jgi:2-oxoglutarate dehydrogenase E1 component
VWVQEEHMNQGCWNYIKPRIKNVMHYIGSPKRAYVTYAGRAPSSSPATGHHHTHDIELKNLLDEAFK